VGVNGLGTLGTVFSPPASASDAWTETAMCSLQGGSDGANPMRGL
jgi:hypothetical protein